MLTPEAGVGSSLTKNLIMHFAIIQPNFMKKMTYQPLLFKLMNIRYEVHTSSMFYVYKNLRSKQFAGNILVDRLQV